MMKRLVECCFFFALLSSTQANITALCDSADMYWEIREDKQENIFTCTGLAAQETVQWALYDSPFQYIYLGFCPPRLTVGQPVCESQYSVTQPSRISDDSSVITINTSEILVSILNGKGRLICSVLNVPGAEASCHMDYIYPGENISCSVQVSNYPRTVFGQCAIGKIRSTQNRYRCEWIRTKESPNEEVLIANTSMTVVSSLGRYFRGWCNFTSNLPPDGQYTYRVTVVPGEVTVIASFIGSSEILKPTVTTPAESTAATTKTTQNKSLTTEKPKTSTTETSTTKLEATTLQAAPTTKEAVTTTVKTREEEITTLEATIKTEESKTTLKASATTTKETAATAEISVGTTEKGTTTTITTATTKVGTITTKKTTVTKEETTKTTTAKTSTAEPTTETATTKKEAASKGETTKQMGVAASTTTATSVLWGQRCQERRCSPCKRVTVKVKLASGPVIYP